MPYLLHQLLERAADRHHDRPALRFDDREWSYATLERRSNQVAHVLLDRNVRRGDRVGIYRAKGLETVAAMYGVLKAGAAYVPIDPWTPAARVARIIADCGIGVLAIDEARLRLIERHQFESHPALCLLGAAGSERFPSVAWDEIAGAPESRPDVRLIDEDLAYILHTSGSTGEPKGMMHTHRSGLAFVAWSVRTFRVRAEDRLANHAPLHFDLSIFDYMASAWAAASTSIVPEPYTKMPADLAAFIERERLTLWYSVPIALMQMQARGLLASRDLSALRLVVFGGEPYPIDQLADLVRSLPGARFCHVYGVTETNVCTYHFVQPPIATDRPLPVGRLCENMDGVVLDADDCPTDEEGELVVRGSAMMRGYWGQPVEDATCFWRRPSPGGHADLFYRTGDLVRLDADGNYVFAGRRDRQVKSRGHRIELDEVQAALAADEGIAEAAVYDVPDAEGSRALVAAVILRDGHRWDQPELVRRLRQRIPGYAVPAHFAVLRTLPRTSAGKVDWQVLRATARIQNSEFRMQNSEGSAEC
jgi:amino acid adenylation domain-containing protein